jgi:SAM-dependent methyltransferase
MSATINPHHEFNPNWRWPSAFEAVVRETIPDDARTLNVCAGLCPVGDVSVDARTPAEIVAQLQADPDADLADARRVLADLLPEEYIGRDVIQELYTADSPAEHELAGLLNHDGFVRTDVFSGLPFATDSFDYVICDPPWIDVSDGDDGQRARLFRELCRVVRSGGRILFNATWLPSGSLPVVLEDVLPRQDTQANSGFTPKVSWAGVYRVEETVDIARHRNYTLPRSDAEYVPEPETTREAARAEHVFGLQRDGVDLSAVDVDAVSPTSEKQCSKCGCPHLEPVNTYGDGEGFDGLYECVECQFRATQDEIVAEGS